MQKLAMLLVFFLVAVTVNAQEIQEREEIQTLFSNRKSLGFYGAYSLAYTRMDHEDGLITGGRAGMIFNHSTAVGLAGYGFFNNLGVYQWPAESMVNYSITGGYGGIFIEPIVGGLKPVHLSFPVLLGMGGAGLLRTYRPGYQEPWEEPWDFTLPEGDFFLVIEPAVELEFNLARVFRTAAYASYRFTSPVELLGKAPDVLRGFNFGLTFKLGKF
ncbi:MAG TPA: hypothetical protein PK489_09535 [Prolixibacteraceae bacterium]|jgi:hypothetical protein|nr:hypothetical protein [Prolixibacteraceae bacterium]